MNIVFDLGGVVFNWSPEQLTQHAFANKRHQQLARQQIIEHEDWLALDRGSLELDAAMANAVKRTGFTTDAVAHFFDRVAPSLTPIHATIDLIHELAGYPRNQLFVLSNMHHKSIDHLEANFDFWSLFQAQVVSCRIGMIKPERQIYDYLLESNALVAGETVFIDDMPENTRAAEAAGIRGIQFTDTASCRAALVDLGCLAPV